MKDNATRFLDAFSQIEQVFKKWNKSSKSYSFSNYVYRYAKSHTLIKRFRDDLLEYSQLRNAIVHDRAGENEIIAQPHDEVVKQIEDLADVLTCPPIIHEVPFDKLVTCQESDSLLETLQTMNRKGYPQLPILNGVMVTGLLTYHMIVSYMIKHIEHKMINLEDVKVSDVVTSSKPAHYVLIQESQEIMSVIEEFSLYQQMGKALSAVIVLNRESKTKGPIGILTSRDIPRLIKLLIND